tara:strand:- start:7433 stop:8644 length:1212 start_codon:yes stop_codon:yes gene_type:complete
MWCTIDVETSIKNRGEGAIGSNQASPFHADNKIVLLGYRDSGGEYTTPGPMVTDYPEESDWGDDYAQIYVGHNIAFDLHYMRKHIDSWMSVIDKVKIWDTMIAEYILSGQTVRFASLNQLSEKYGGTLKDEKIAEYWAKGVDTEDIPREELAEYLRNDVENTETIFLAQFIEAEKLGVLPLIEAMMESRLATWEMEWNGMHIDTRALGKAEDEIGKELILLTRDLANTMDDYITEGPRAMPSSNDQVSLVLFGGTYKVTVDAPVFDEATGKEYRYRSGKRKGRVKTKKAEKEVTTKGMGVGPAWGTPTKKSGIYSVGEDTLKDLARACREAPTKWDKTVEFLEDLLKYRELYKEQTTYIDGFKKLIWPDGKIHGQFNHTQTRTGRLSSSRPNMQNLTNKDTEM